MKPMEYLTIILLHSFRSRMLFELGASAFDLGQHILGGVRDAFLGKPIGLAPSLVCEFGDAPGETVLPRATRCCGRARCRVRCSGNSVRLRLRMTRVGRCDRHWKFPLMHKD